MNVIRIRPDAELEITEAFRWYESCRPGLGHDFLEMLDDAFTRIARFPESCPIIRRNTRRAFLKRFPYLLFYRQIGETILIIACLHPSQDPKQWPR